MATWNLHIVASKEIEDVDAMAAEIVTVVEGYDHELVSAVLTTDEGSQDITPAPTPPDEELPPEEESPPEETADDATYEANTVDELRDELRNRGLQTSGNKEELVARLEEHDNAE